MKEVGCGELDGETGMSGSARVGMVSSLADGAGWERMLGEGFSFPGREVGAWMADEGWRMEDGG